MDAPITIEIWGFNEITDISVLLLMVRKHTTICNKLRDNSFFYTNIVFTECLRDLCIYLCSLFLSWEGYILQMSWYITQTYCLFVYSQSGVKLSGINSDEVNLHSLHKRSDHVKVINRGFGPSWRVGWNNSLVWGNGRTISLRLHL